MDCNEEPLVKLAEELEGQVVRPLVMDLSNDAIYDELTKMMKEEDVVVTLLINCAGFGKFEAVMNIPRAVADKMLAVNCKAVMDLCYVCYPFMKRGSKILNVSSIAAFQPVPYLDEYGASKAFVLSFSRALWKELRPEGITVTALCPYWTRTHFYEHASSSQEASKVHYFSAMSQPKHVVNAGWKALKRGSDMTTYGFSAYLDIFLATILPHKLVMSIWCMQQKHSRTDKDYGIRVKENKESK